MMSKNKLIPPFNEPMYLNNQMTPAWRNFFEEVAKVVNQLNG